MQRSLTIFGVALATIVTIRGGEAVSDAFQATGQWTVPDAPTVSASGLTKTSRPEFTHTFDHDNEGWRIVSYPFRSHVANPATAVLSHDATFGNPAGSVRLGDAYPETGIAAPVEYLGNRAPFYGGNLTYDIYIRHTDNTTYPAVVLNGGTRSLYYDAPSPPLNAWQRRTVPLSEVGWKVSGSGAVVTASDFRAVLSNLVGIYIYTEWRTGPDDTSVDNITLPRPPLSPAIVQITDRSGGGGPCSNCCQIVHRQPVMAPQGDQFTFASTWNRDDAAGNPNTNRNTEVFRYEIASGLYIEDTRTDIGISVPFDFTDTSVAIISSSPELLANTDTNADVFSYPRVLPTNAQAVTVTTGPIPIDHDITNTCPRAWFVDTNWWTLANTHADISADDAFIVWAGNRDIPSFGAPAGTNSDENYEIWLKDLNAGTVRQLTETTGGDSESPARGANLWPRVGTGGGRVVFVSNRSIDGSSIMTNRHGLFVWTPGGTTRLMTADLTVERDFPAFGMNAAGTRVVFAADADLTGHNSDGNVEIFAVSVPSGVMTQITDSAASVTNSRPVLSGDGKKVAFLSNGDYSGFGQNADGSQELWVYHFDQDRLYVDPFIQVTSLATTPSALRGRTHWMDWYSLDSDGSHLVMCTDGDLTGGNPGNYYEIFLATFDWDPEPEVTIAGIPPNDGTPVLQWQGNRTNLLYMVESCTNLPTAGWSPAVPTSQWWISETIWTNTGPARFKEFFRIRAKEQ